PPLHAVPAQYAFQPSLTLKLYLIPILQATAKSTAAAIATKTACGAYIGSRMKAARSAKGRLPIGVDELAVSAYCGAMLGPGKRELARVRGYVASVRLSILLRISARAWSVGPCRERRLYAGRGFHLRCG